MKNLLRLSSLLALVAVFAVSFSSCDKDVCYECDEYELTEAGVTFTVPAVDVCEGDDDGNGGTYTETSLKADVAAYEALGANCSKK